jgi:hypothetical protein
MAHRSFGHHFSAESVPCSTRRFGALRGLFCVSGVNTFSLRRGPSRVTQLGAACEPIFAGTRRKYFQRKNVWTVIAGLRGEDRIAQLCRKKDFSRTFLITANRRIS